MNKSQIVDKIANKVEISKTKAEQALDEVMSSIKNALKKNDTVTLVGVGTFSVNSRASRMGINPRTKQPIKIKASKAPKFKAGKAFKDFLN